MAIMTGAIFEERLAQTFCFREPRSSSNSSGKGKKTGMNEYWVKFLLAGYKDTKLCSPTVMV